MTINPDRDHVTFQYYSVAPFKGFIIAAYPISSQETLPKPRKEAASLPHKEGRAEL